MQPLSEVELQSSSNDFLTIQGMWDLRKLEEWLPGSMCRKIMGISPPSPWKIPSQFACKHTSDGVCFVQLAYPIAVSA